MKKIGFIAEGDCEGIFLNSTSFQNTLKLYKLDCVGIFNLGGRDNFWGANRKLIGFVDILKEREANSIFFLLDFEFDNCFTEIKDKISNHSENQTIIIAKRTIESWYLADSDTLSRIFKRKYNYNNPEDTDKLPFDILREEFIVNNNGRGPGVYKTRFTNKLIDAGFSLEGACTNENCKSAIYFLEKLKKLSE